MRYVMFLIVVIAIISVPSHSARSGAWDDIKSVVKKVATDIKTKETVYTCKFKSPDGTVVSGVSEYQTMATEYAREALCVYGVLSTEVDFVTGGGTSNDSPLWDAESCQKFQRRSTFLGCINKTYTIGSEDKAAYRCTVVAIGFVEATGQGPTMLQAKLMGVQNACAKADIGDNCNRFTWVKSCWWGKL